MAEIHVLKNYSAPSVSGRSTIQYAIGTDETGEVYLRITGSGGGFYDASWISWRSINDLLANLPETFTTLPFSELFRGRSTNNAGYAGSYLLAEKVIVRQRGKRRIYALGDVDAFIDKVTRLKSNKRAPAKKRPARKKPA